MQTCPEPTQEPANSPDVQPERKFCPLFLLVNSKPFSLCLGESCAWAMPSPAGGWRCALPRLVDKLAYLGAGLDSLVGLVEPVIRQDPGYLKVRVL